MKQTKKFFVLILIALLSLSFAVFAAACEKKVKLSFVTNGGSPVATLSVAAGSEVELPLSLKSGQVLTGWYLDESLTGSSLLGKITAPEEDTTYYAKWADGYTVSFDADGGVFERGTPSLTLAAGANLYDAVKEISPTKSGLDFGAWFLGDAEIASGYRMPAESITLTAKYKVEYAMETYLRNLAGNSYVRSDEVQYASDYVGTTLTPDVPMVTGFTPTDNLNSVTTVILDKDASRNVFRFYYDRLSCRLVFDANLPAGTSAGSMENMEALYGEWLDLPENNYSCPGYRFAGWSSYRGGDVDYYTGSRYLLLGDNVLYAVWDKGYTDRYGGSDIIFFPRSNENRAILSRGGQEFVGTREGDNFSFATENGNTFDGRVYGSMFSYARSDLEGTYTFMELSKDGRFTPSFDAARTLTVDRYLGGTYTVGGRTYSGEVFYSDETGDYTFESGQMKFRFLPVRSDTYEYENSFLVGGDETASYLDFVMVDPALGAGYPVGSWMLILDGYGNAMLGDMTNYLTYDGSYYTEGTYTVGELELIRVTCFIRDPDGYLTGTAGATTTNYIYLIPVEGAEFSYYVQADVYRDEYADGADGTLTLDGFGVFDDSAVYTAGNVTVKGMYSVSSDLLSGDVITIIPERGDRVSFRLDTEKHSFSAPPAGQTSEYVELRRMNGSTLTAPFVVIYNEDVAADGVTGKRTEIFMPDEAQGILVKAASGYSVITPIGANDRLSFSRYRFTRTQVESGYEDTVPELLDFYDSIVTNPSDYRMYNVYCVLEETIAGKNTKYLTEYAVTGGGRILTTSSVATGGLGSLYVQRNGTVQEGGFTTKQSENFSGTIGTFTYATEAGEVVELSFDITRSDDGSMNATLRTAPEQTLYVVQPTGIAAGGVGVEMFFIDGNGRAKYTSDSGDHFIEGSYAPTGETTCFGETIYAFTVTGTERFRFVMYELPEEEYAGVPLLIKFDSEFATTLKTDTLEEHPFVSEGGEELLLDGYHTASLGGVRGNYYRDVLCRTLYFTDLNGTQHVLELDLENGSFRRMDWATQRVWELVDSNFDPINGYTLTFTDFGYKKEATVKNGGTTIATGTYLTLDTVNQIYGYEEYLLRGVTFGTGYPMGAYRVTFVTGGGFDGSSNVCLVYNADASGVFTDENWNVLLLDGFGGGQYFTADYSGAGSYKVLDFDVDFLEFTVDDAYSSVDGEVYYFRLENRQFTMTDYATLSGVYFSDELETVAFGTDGNVYLGVESGPYYVKDGRVHVYLDDGHLSFEAPQNGSLHYGNKTYRRLADGAIVMSGKVLLLEADGKPAPEEHPEELSATLTFTPNLTTNRNRPAVFTFTGMDGEFSGYSLSLYSGGDSLTDEVGSFSPTVTYGRNSYPISFRYENGSYTFTVTAGFNSVEYLDHNARYEPNISTPRGMRFFKETFGFGAVQYGDVTISGDFLYLYDKNDPVYSKPVHFEGVKEKDIKVVGSVPGYGDRLEFTFRAEDGKDYLLNYYEYYQGGVYFWCYGLFSYQEVETEAYRITVKSLLYTKMSIAPGYFDAQNGSGKALGHITGVTLFDKETGKPVVAYDTGITPNGYDKGVWLVEKESVLENGSQGTCAWGTGYLVNFTFDGDGKTVTAATVEKYDFVQVVNYMKQLVNLFIDEDGKVLLASVLVYNPEFGRYDFAGAPHDLTEENGSFTFRATWAEREESYTVTVEASDDVTFRDDDGERHTMPGYTVTVTVS